MTPPEAGPVLSGSGRIGEPVTVDPGTWAGTAASLRCQWLRDGAEIAGATGASYTPVPADDRTALACRVTATGPDGSVTAVTAALPVSYPPPVARGELLEEIFDQGSGVQTVAAAPDFTGENLAFSVAGAGATVDPATGIVAIPTDTALSDTVAVTATNSGGGATSAFPVTVEAAGSEELLPFPLTAAHVLVLRSEWRPAGQETWFSPVVRFPGLAGETVAAIEWTTSAGDELADDAFGVARRIGATDSFALHGRDALSATTPAEDPGVWRADDPRRDAVRFRWQRTAEGPWSPVGDELPVPEPGPAGNQWVPLITRSEAQFEAGLIGGPGFQFLRDFATTPADPEIMLCPMDQNFPWASADFGTSFYTPRWQGLWVGRSGLSAWIDPEDPNRQLLMYSAASQGFDKKFDAYSGVYLSRDGGQTASLVLSLPRLTATTVARHNMSLFTHAPGGTPETRTIYAMQVSHGETSAAETIQLWRSTDGGARWTQVGGALAPKTVAEGKNAVWGIAMAPGGDLYQWGRRGAWRSPAGPEVGTAWTKLASLPAGKAVHLMDVAHGDGVVWAAVDGKGLYQASDGESFTLNAGLGPTDIRAFGISPEDRNYMVACKVRAPNQFWSHDGGRTWTEGVSAPAPAQPDSFGNKMGSGDHYGVVPKWGDRDTWFFHRSQHMGISRDGGRTVEWTGRYYDGSHTHAIGFHPTDWQTFALAQQDRSLILTRNAGGSWSGDRIGGPKDKPETPAGQIVAVVGEIDHIAGSGTFMHASGRIITQQGFHGRKVACILYPKGDDPIGNCRVTRHVSKVNKYASLDPHDGDSGYAGKFRVGNLGAADVDDITFTEMAYFFFGASGAGGTTTIYGGTWRETPRSIWRSTDGGASWGGRPWITTAASFRPVDTTPAVAVCPHHPARVYAPSGDGRAVRIEGADAPTETEIFDARTYLGPGRPKYAINSIAVDPRDEDVLYVSLFMWGGPTVFCSRDRGASWSDVSGNVPPLDGVLFVHPLTSEVFFGSSHGTWVLAPPAAAPLAAAARASGSVAQRAQSFLERGR